MPLSPERKAVLTATATAAGLVAAKGAVGVATGSMAVLASAADSFLDLCVSLANLLALRVAERPADPGHPYGHGKIEGLAALGEGLVVMGSGAWIAWEAVGRLWTGEYARTSGWPFAVMAVSMAATWALVRFLSAAAKRHDNAILRADAAHYRTDLWSNAGILVSLALVWALGVPALDPIVSVAVAAWIAKGGLAVVREGADILMDAAIEPAYVAAAEGVVARRPELGGLHLLKTRKSGKHRLIEMHVVFRDPRQSLFSAHAVGEEVEAEIAREIPGAVVTLHLDPCDDRTGRCELPPRD